MNFFRIFEVNVCLRKIVWISINCQYIRLLSIDHWQSIEIWTIFLRHTLIQITMDCQWSIDNNTSLQKKKWPKCSQYNTYIYLCFWGRWFWIPGRFFRIRSRFKVSQGQIFRFWEKNLKKFIHRFFGSLKPNPGSSCLYRVTCQGHPRSNLKILRKKSEKIRIWVFEVAHSESGVGSPAPGHCQGHPRSNLKILREKSEKIHT